MTVASSQAKSLSPVVPGMLGIQTTQKQKDRNQDSQGLRWQRAAPSWARLLRPGLKAHLLREQS